MMLHPAYSLILAALLASPAFALEAQEFGHPCAATKDADQRLECYDRAFPPAPDADGATTGADLEARRAQAVEEYGLNRRQVFERRPEAEREIEPSRIEGVVKGMVERATGERVVTLENGHVWLLTEVTSRGRLKVGDAVTVRNAALGTYMLVTPNGVALRARRLH